MSTSGSAVKSSRQASVAPPEDAVLVMGMTGSGKSTFISLLADAGEAVQVGNDLSSYTTQANGYVATIDGRSTILLDTPGFDDTDRPDFEIVNEIAMGLHVLYEKRLNLLGVIYIQRITDTRMSGSSRRSLDILDAICGASASANITFVTTMWDKLGLDSRTVGEERTGEMKRLFLAKFMDRGAQIEQHVDTPASAENILNKILTCNQPVMLGIQHELEVQRFTLEQTAVGQILQHDLQRKQKEFEAELKEIQQQLLEAQQSNDSTAIRVLTEEVARQKEQMRRLHTSRSQLRFGVQQLGEMRNASMERELEEAQILALGSGRESNNDIKAQIERTTQHTRLLRDFRESEERRFYEENAIIQNRRHSRNEERMTAQRVKMHAEREERRRAATRVRGFSWEVSVEQVYRVRRRSRGY